MTDPKISPHDPRMMTPPLAPQADPSAARQQPAYRARLACTAADLRAVQAWRFEVFNLELDEGLVDSCDTGLDVDPVDAVCDHLLGCSSLTTQDTAVGAAAYRALRESHLAPPAWRTDSTPPFACPLQPEAAEAPHIPRLLSAYLALGAAMCGPPAIDRAFRAVDFLTWLGLKSPVMQALQARGRFIG